MWKQVWPVLLLLCVSIGIAFFNVQKGTWLIGWDSTQPELNFPLNLSRELSAVWQEYRGLGVTDGMAHSANLVHLVYAWIISKIVGVSYVRYVFMILAHFAGGMGMYTLLRYLGRFLRGEKVSRWIALSGALFYLFNPYTLQMFYQPLELFVTHFVALPWLTFTLIQYVSEPSRRNLWWFALVNILTLPQAHVPTLFIVWIMLATCLLLPVLLLRARRYGKQILMVILVSVGIHGFWGLPYIYSALNNAKNIGEAKINVLSNPEVLLRNDAYGDMNSIVKMQGFTLAFEDWNPGYKYGLQMPEWVNWWGQEWVIWVSGGMMVLAGVGIVASLVQRKWWTVGVVLMYVLALGNLGAQIPYVREIGVFLREYVPYYEAIFRFTFTKFALVYAFVFTILMIIGILSFYRLVRGWMSLILSVVVIVGVIVVSWPAWRGQFFYHNLKLQVPGEYLNMFKFFDTHSVGRVLPLPYPDFWGWQSNEWGYRGSGFVWQGIRNSTLYGSFNAWSPYNEGFYNQISTALYGCGSGQSEISNSQILKLDCGEQVQKVLEQYDVKYVLLDESVIAPGQGKEILRIEETKKLAEELGWEQKFQEGFLTVWDTGIEIGEKIVSAPGSYTWMEADTIKVREDVVYGEVGHYVTAVTQPLDDTVSRIIYPFASLMREEAKNVVWGEGGVAISASVPTDTVTRELVVPGWEVGEIVRVDFTEDDIAIPAYTLNGQSGPVFLGEEKPTVGKSYYFAKVSEGEEWREYRESRKYLVSSGKIEVEIKGEPFVYDFAKQGQGSIGNCDVLKRGVATKDGGTYTADSRGAVCDYIVMEAPFTRVPYLLRLRGENVEGRSIKFFLWNTGSKRNDIEYLLGKGKFDQTFALLPWDWDGYYTLNIETRSFGQRAENRMDPVVGMYVPLEKIARARIAPARSDLVGFDEDLQPTRSDLKITYVKKTGTWLYGLGVKGQGLIRLSQGYDKGWVGLHIGEWSWKKPFDFAQGLRHVKVDGWSNGWLIGANPPTPMASDGRGGWIVEGNNERITDNRVVILFYWPQLLQYLGFVMLGVTIVGLIIPHHKR